VQIVPPNETVVVIGFELKMGNRAGTMSLCIPYNVIEPIMGVLAAQNWFSYQRKGGQDDHLKKLTRNVSNAKVEMRAFLAQTTITMSELLALQVGDVITTDKNIERDVLIQIEGKNKFFGKVGQFRGARAVSVSRVCAAPRRHRPLRVRPLARAGDIERAGPCPRGCEMSRAAVPGSSAKLADSGSSAAAASYLGRSHATADESRLPAPFHHPVRTRPRLLLTDRSRARTTSSPSLCSSASSPCLGATGRHLPALAVVSILLAWHLAKKDAWTVTLPTLLGMSGREHRTRTTANRVRRLYRPPVPCHERPDLHRAAADGHFCHWEPVYTKSWSSG
jgi:flagellar motor switch/type III secretory pathway protein FliN